MNKLVTTIALILSLGTKSQTVADFETFTLSANSFYKSLSSTPFQTSNALFQYQWDPSFGGFWVGGFSYTNNYDSTTAGFTNLYGVKAYKGYNGSSTYVVAQNAGVIKLKSPFKTVDGFYITNTTYAFKSIKNGDMIARKFGDTTGTHSGTTIAQGSYPDFFKVTAKGYLAGSMKQDSSVFFLADYRFANNAQDYVVNTWQWFNTSNLGAVDSIQFFMYSSDVGQVGMNTPAFFGMDGFTTSAPNTVGLNTKQNNSIKVYPNPFSSQIIISDTNNEEIKVALMDGNGKVVYLDKLNEGANTLDLSTISPGIYFLQVEVGDKKTIKRITKN